MCNHAAPSQATLPKHRLLCTHLPRGYSTRVSGISARVHVASPAVTRAQPTGPWLIARRTFAVKRGRGGRGGGGGGRGRGRGGPGRGRGRGRGGPPPEAHRINEKIRGVKEVRLINDDGTFVGIVPFAEALQAARKQSVDLVEVAPQAKPVVCKLQDYKRVRCCSADARLCHRIFHFRTCVDARAL